MSFRRGGPFAGPPHPEPPTRVPKERRGHTIGRIAAFFRPYRLQVAVVLVAILATSLLGLVNPILLKLLIDEALPKLDFGLLNLFVGLMILAHLHRPSGGFFSGNFTPRVTPRMRLVAFPVAILTFSVTAAA